MMKSGVSHKVVSETLKIPKRTLHDWKSASIKSGNWFGAEGDNGLARPAKRRSDLGSGTKNRKVTEELKRKIEEKLERNPFLTAFGLQKEIPGLRDVKLRTIRDIIKRKLDIPSRLAAKKPFLTDFQKARRLARAERYAKWSCAKWAKVLWSDETHIEQWVGAHQSKRVCRNSVLSRYDPRFVLRTVKHPPKLMIWATQGSATSTLSPPMRR